MIGGIPPPRPRSVLGPRPSWPLSGPPAFRPPRPPTRGYHQSLAIDAVGGDASERRNEEDGNLAGKADASQQQGRFRHAVDEPGLGYGLHPGADERDKLSAEEELKIAVAQGTQGGGPFRQARRFPSRFFSCGGIWR